MLALPVLERHYVDLCTPFSYFDFHSEEHFHRMREIAQRKIRKKLWGEHNNNIRRDIDSIMNKGLSITRGAYEKLEHIISQFSDLTERANGKSYELSFYLLADKGETGLGDTIISDVYIAQDQEVLAGNCAISGEGDIMSIRDIRDNLDKRIVGWGHSHGNNPVFFSSRDVRTFLNFLVDYGMFGNLGFEHYGHSHDYTIEHTFGLVVNAQNEDPLVVLNISYPQYAVDDKGVVSFGNRTERFEGMRLNLIEDEFCSPCDEEKEEISDQLKNRVRLMDEDKRLMEYFVDEDIISSEDELPIGDHSEVKEKIYEFPVKEESFSRDDYVPLSERLTELELQYNDLLNDYHQLEERVAYLGMQPIDRSLSYSSGMRQYYTRLMTSENKEEQLLGKISKIMAGQYRSNLENISEGNYEEDSGETRIWFWEYLQNKDVISGFNNGLIERLNEILMSNRYLRRKHPDKLDRIMEIFSG